jgi:hypothetical protein
VSVGRNPDLQKVLQMFLIALDKETYQRFNFPVLQDITQFIDELREFLHDKRYAKSATQFNFPFVLNQSFNFLITTC